MQGVFQYGILAPFRRPPRDPAQLLQPPRQLPEIEDGDDLARGDGPHCELRLQAADRQRHNNRVHKRRPNAQREAATPFFVETLRRADRPYTDDEMDSVRPGTEQNLSGVSDSENQEETLEEPAGTHVPDTPAPTTQTNTVAAKSDLDHLERERQKGNTNCVKDERSRTEDRLESVAEVQSAPTDIQVSFSYNTKNNHYLHPKIANVCNFTLLNGTTLQLGTSASGLKAIYEQVGLLVTGVAKVVELIECRSAQSWFTWFNVKLSL